MPAVFCNSIKNIVWQKAIDPSFSLSSSIDLWQITVSPDLWLLNYFDQVLSKEESERANRFHQENDRQRFIISRGALKYLLSKYLGRAPQQIEFTTRANKKPMLKTEQEDGLQFNIAHSGAKILIAIAEQEVGIDLEMIDTKFSYQDILTLHFTAEERAFIDRSGQPRKCFYLLWTRKEAILKATAKGIENDLPAVPGLDGMHSVEKEAIGSERPWETHSFIFGERYIGTLAHDPEAKLINYLDTPSSFFLQSV
jgi:4'-phosphopantetheinyl transferase